MCGIIGIVGTNDVVPRLLNGLKRLEYRGYDSAGIAVHADGMLIRRRKSGNISNLEKLVGQEPVQGISGIAHTRWATHGAPTDNNAHPHMTDSIAIVHNGIIENHAILRQELITKGYQFTSDTDTEVVAYLLTDYLQQKMPPLAAVQATLQKIRGAYSFVILFREYPDLMMGVRSGSPLAIGYGHNEMFLGSDAVALSHLADKISYLEDGDIAVLQSTGVSVYDSTGSSVNRIVQKNTVAADNISKGKYEHYMLKEIFEQPEVIQRTMSRYVTGNDAQIKMPTMDLNWEKIKRITIIGCGTAFYAGLVAKYWLEKIARVPVELDIASEFRYRQPPLPEDSVCVFISQSGETADTLAAFAYTQKMDQYTIGIVNVATSSLARQVDTVLLTDAGVEIGVASTKAFTAQLNVLAMLTLHIAHARGTLKLAEIANFLDSLKQIPVKITEMLHQDLYIDQIAEKVAMAQDVLYLGRGVNYATAMEGALKLKELSYIHAEGYAAGEMKHGPIALIDENVPIIVIAPRDELFEKTLSNIEECLARKGKIIIFTDENGVSELRRSRKNMDMIDIVVISESNFFTAPILYAIPVQRLAYNVALKKGTNVDQPRNLAKSVTVE